MMPPKVRLMWPIIRRVQRRRTPVQAAGVVIRAATDPGLAGRSGVWIGQHNRLGQPAGKALDVTLAAEVYSLATGILDRAKAYRA